MKKAKIITSFLMLASLTACGGNYSYPSFGPLQEGQKYNVGILLPVEHDALNKAKDGFIQGLSENGWDNTKLNIEVKNALGSGDDQRTMAKTLIGNCDLTLGIGTGAAQDLKTAQKNKGSKNPILFTAVTDPVDAKLVDSIENTTGFVTGTSDAQPIDAQIEIIKECIPDVDKIGLFYTQSETNSVIQAKQAKTAIEAIGASCVIKTCTNATDVASSIASLMSEDGLDAIYIPTDNNVASNLNHVRNAAKGKGVLIVGAEEGMLSTGAHITLSISYTELGKKAGVMASQILSGEKTPSQLPILTMSKEECSYVMSSVLLQEAGITLPESVSGKCIDLN